MNEEEIGKKLSPPYLPYKTFIELLESLRTQGIPARLDRSFLSSFSGTIQRQLQNALKYFGMIAEDEKSLEKLQKLVSLEGEERKEFLMGLVEGSYSFLFKDGTPLDQITDSQFRELFESAGTSGDTTIKAKRFFIEVAKEAGLGLSTLLKKARTASPRKKAKPAKDTTSETEQLGESRANAGFPPSSIDKEYWNRLLDKFPVFDPNWSSDAQIKWFELYDKMLERKSK